MWGNTHMPPCPNPFENIDISIWLVTWNSSKSCPEASEPRQLTSQSEFENFYSVDYRGCWLRSKPILNHLKTVVANLTWIWRCDLKLWKIVTVVRSPNKKNLMTVHLLHLSSLACDCPGPSSRRKVSLGSRMKKICQTILSLQKKCHSSHPNYIEQGFWWW